MTMTLPDDRKKDRKSGSHDNTEKGMTMDT